MSNTLQLGQETPYDYETLSLAGTALGFTASKFTPSTTDADKVHQCRKVLITAEVADLRYTLHGVAPTQAAIGHLLMVGSTLELDNRVAMTNFLIINDSSAAEAHVTYFR